MILRKIKNALDKFELDLKGKTVLTEAATGNYAVTPVIAALAGANVTAVTQASVYGSVDEVKRQTYELAGQCGVSGDIKVVEDLAEIDLKKIDVVTNTGFLRPLDRPFLEKLSPCCVIPLMWEPWEYRLDDLDLEACADLGLKVYGTDERDPRLGTMEYIGYAVLYHLLKHRQSPRSARVLLLGSERLLVPVTRILQNCGYELTAVKDYSETFSVENYSAIVVLEHERNRLIIGEKNSVIDKTDISSETLVVHICGAVDFKDAVFKYLPEKPRPFGYMSYTADFIDIQAVIDLHTAGLKVAEGMLLAHDQKLKGEKFKFYMENNFPALSFKEERFW